MGEKPEIDSSVNAFPVAAVVLAAGRSTRMAPENKLLVDYKGLPVVRHVALASLESSTGDTLVVTGHASAAVEAALTGLDLRFVHNPAYGEGLSTTVKAGIKAVGSDMAGAMMLLGDMPDLTADLLNQLISAFEDSGGDRIIHPRYQGRPGNPVIWPRRMFAAFDQLTGDVGAKSLLAQHPDLVLGVDLDAPAIHMDIDAPGDLPQDRVKF